MSAPPGFAQRVSGYSDLQLAEVLASPSDYTPDAIKIVFAEWERRKLTPDAVAPALAEAEIRAELQAQPCPTRPMTFKGIGLICYGRDYAQTIGYTTTQWLCVFWVPLLPVQSFNVDEVAFGTGGVASAVRMNVRQVVRIYLFLLFLAGFGIGGSWLISTMYDSGHDYWALLLSGIFLCVPTLVLGLIRRTARRNRPNTVSIATGSAR